MQKLVKSCAFAGIILFSLLTVGGITNAKEDTSTRQVFSGPASWYGGYFHGRTTANGERYDMNGLTAAHRSLPFGTKVRVTNLKNGRSVTVRINDRGPYVGKRIIDLSRGAAQAVNMIRAGVALVRLEVLGS
jgi:rare lipoprotein A